MVRATLDDAGFRVRQAPRLGLGDRKGKVTDEAVALQTALTILRTARPAVQAALTDELLAEAFGRIAEDIETDGPLPWRVDGRELVKDVAVASKRPELLAALTRAARLNPPAALVDEMRACLGGIPGAWLA